ncbi:MAG: hypothetical protein LBQ70_01195 [Prevotellaceae bacterium]|nr:hypothetical protein [Prevotellaceae bacterium]
MIFATCEKPPFGVASRYAEQWGAKQPEGLNFHNRRSSTCGSHLPNNCLKGRTKISPAFDYVELTFQAEIYRCIFRRSMTCGYENQALRAVATPKLSRLPFYVASLLQRSRKP